MTLKAPILFLLPEQIIFNESARWPQSCVPDNGTALGPCADGGIRDKVAVRIKDDARMHSFLESGFEVVRVRRNIVGMLDRLTREGLSGAESPGAAVSTGLLTILRDRFKLVSSAADSAIARAVEGVQAFNLRDALFTASLRCSGLIVRRSGPNLTAPLDAFPSRNDPPASNPKSPNERYSRCTCDDDSGFNRRRRASGEARWVDKGPGKNCANAGPRTGRLDHSGDTRLPAYTGHVDQDVFGEPLMSMGLSWVFTSIPFVRLINVWLPFSPVPVRPLALMDVRSLNRKADLVFYRASFKINSSSPTDVLLLRHSRTQRWHYDSLISPGEAIVFDATATPHASFEVPGENTLSELRRLLLGWLSRQNSCATGWTTSDGQDMCTGLTTLATKPEVSNRNDEHLIDRLIKESRLLIREICEDACHTRNHTMQSYLVARANDILRRSERFSLEMRCAAIVIPRDPRLVTAVPLSLFCVILGWCSTRQPRRRKLASSQTACDASS